MKAIIDGRLYDTEKARKVGTLECVPCEVYKTGNGNLFLLEKFIGITNADQDEIREMIGIQDPDLYISLFGEVEEA